MLVVCNPPEMGWVEASRTDEQATMEAELLAAPRAPHCDCEQACDECVKDATRNG